MGNVVAAAGRQARCMTEAEGRCCRLEADLARRTSFSVHMKRRMTAVVVGTSRRLIVGEGGDLMLSLCSSSNFQLRIDGLRQTEGSDKARFQIVPCLVVRRTPVCLSCRFGTDGLPTFDRNIAQQMRALSASPRARRVYSWFHHKF